LTGGEAQHKAPAKLVARDARQFKSRCQAPNSKRTSFLDRERIEIGKDRVNVFVGKVDLRHRPVFGNHALPEFCLQLPRDEPGVDIAHRRGLLERALAGGFDGMTAAAILLKDNLASAPEQIRVAGICGRGKPHKQSGDPAPGVTSKTRRHLFKSSWSARDAADAIGTGPSVGKYHGHQHGMAAPTENITADESAACTGRDGVISGIPSSSRA
jgi:hypothetical protein